MLVIQVPDGGDRKRRLRRRRARGLAYIACGLLIGADLALSPGWWWFAAAVAVEMWWFWAVSTDPRMRRLR